MPVWVPGPGNFMSGMWPPAQDNTPRLLSPCMRQTTQALSSPRCTKSTWTQAIRIRVAMERCEEPGERADLISSSSQRGDICATLGG